MTGKTTLMKYYTKQRGDEMKMQNSTKEDFLRESDFVKINSDVNGNPRYVIHFLQCEPQAWKDNYHVCIRYKNVCKLMNKIGGRKFNNKSYGGGIVFQCYSIPDLIEHIERVKASI